MISMEWMRVVELVWSATSRPAISSAQRLGSRINIERWRKKGATLDLSAVDDFANQANEEIGKFQVTMTLSPDKLAFNSFNVASLNWESIEYGRAEIDKVPADRRGVYAFSISQPSQVLPPHGHILYIGIAGRKSDRSLRERYKDYLTTQKIMKRAKITRMIGTWRNVLRFHFAPVDNSMTSEELEQLEEDLNTALLPPFSVGDLEADTKKKRRAFQ